MIRNHRQGFLLHAGLLSFQSSLELTLDHAVRPFQIWDTGSSTPIASHHSGNASFDNLLAGFSYTSPSFGVSLGWRIRGENTWSAGNGWYDTTTEVVDRSLTQNLNIRHEFGLGIAWEYELISGWLTDLSKLHVGVTPKVVIPGLFIEQQIQSIYGQTESGIPTHVGSYDLLSAGAMGNFATGADGLPLRMEDMLTPTGIGGGLDMGFTYIIGLGNEQSLGFRRRDETKNSIRLSASINDVGIVSHTKLPVRRSAGSESATNAPISAPLTSGYIGAAGQFEAILAETVTEKGIRDRSVPGETGSINLTLPTMMNGGGAIQLNRVLFTGDIRIPLSTHPYYADSRTLRIGTELKLLRTLPLRGGVVFREGYETTYTAGFALDFRNIDFSTALQFRVTDAGDFQPVGLGVAALHIRL